MPYLLLKKKKKLFPELKNHLDSSDSEYRDGCAYSCPKAWGGPQLPGCPNVQSLQCMCQGDSIKKANTSVWS